MKSHTIRYRICTCDVDIRKSYKAFSFMTQAQEIANYHASRIGFGYADLQGQYSLGPLPDESLLPQLPEVGG